MAALVILMAASGIAFSRPTDKVDINHASLAELRELPGMTQTWAQRIVHFRPYRTKLDLLQQGILPAKLYSQIRDGIVAHRDPK